MPQSSAVHPRLQWLHAVLFLAACNGLIICVLYGRILPWASLLAHPAALLGLLSYMLGHTFALGIFFTSPGLILGWAGLRRLAALTGALSMGVALIFLVISSFSFDLFGFHVNFMVLDLLFGDDSLKIIALNAMTWMIGFGIVVACISGQIALLYLGYRLSAGSSLIAIRRWSMAMFGLWLTGHVAHAAAYWHDYRPLTTTVRYTPWSIPFTLRDLSAEKTTIPPHMLEPQDADTTFDLRLPRQPLQCAPPAQPLNILFLVIDSWRPGTIDPVVMPHTAELASRSQVFAHHSANANGTLHGFFTLMTGLYGSYWHSALKSEQGSILINTLAQQNYQFWLHPSAPLSNPPFDRVIFSQVRASVHPPYWDLPTWGRDRAVIRDLTRAVRNHTSGSAPFFGLVFLDAAHSFSYPAEETAPFQPTWPEGVRYETLRADMDGTGLLNRNNNSLLFIDRELAKLYQVLESTGRMTDTVILLTGDHGQEFNDNRNNAWGHNTNLANLQTHTPLVVYWPGREATVFEHRTGHLDIVPTLMHDALGCINPTSDYSNGTSLYNSEGRDFVYLHSWSRNGYIKDNYIHIWEWPVGLDVFYGDEYRPAYGESWPEPAIVTAIERERRRFAAP